MDRRAVRAEGGSGGVVSALTAIVVGRQAGAVGIMNYEREGQAGGLSSV